LHKGFLQKNRDGEAIGIKEQMVQRYEASGYESILRMRGYANGFSAISGGLECSVRINSGDDS
jgi:hypothetical protein